MDRRREPRGSAREEAVVRERSGRTVRALVIETSARGARILVGENEQLPDVFDLVLSKGGRTMRCGVVWHVGGVYGLTELGALAGDGVLDLASGKPAAGMANGGLIKARYRG